MPGSPRHRPPRAAVSLGLAVASALAGCAVRASVHPRAAAEVASGYRHLSSGDAERAEVAFEHALAFDPDLPEAENGLGIVARIRGDLDGARRRFTRAVRLRPDFAEGYANLGEALLAAGEDRAAEAELRAALAIDPDLGDARQNLARALIHAGLAPGADQARWFGRARRELLHLLEGNPDRAEAHHDLGFLEYAAGRHAEAERSYRRAVELAPTAPEPLHGWCVSLVRVGRCAEAAAACERCLAVAPGSDRCRTSLRGARACAGE